MKVTYEERQALITLRKSIARGRAHLLEELFTDISKNTIGNALIAAKTELNNNLMAVRVLQTAAQKLMEDMK